MKKFILLLLILPLTLMARPEKMYIDNMPYQFFGALIWKGTVLNDSNCAFNVNSTAETWVDFPQDTDCSDTADAVDKYGNVASDVSVNSDDIEYPQIILKSVPKGYLFCKSEGHIFTSTTVGEYHWALYDSTNSSTGFNLAPLRGAAGTFLSQVSNLWYYDKPQETVTIKMRTWGTSNTNGPSYLFARGQAKSKPENFSIICWIGSGYTPYLIKK